VTGYHPRDVLDLLRIPSVNRVAPLAQVVGGEFYTLRNTSGNDCEACWRFVRRLLAAAYYVVLKLPATLVYLGLPALALVPAATKFSEVKKDTVFLKCIEVVSYAFLLVATLAFLQVVILEAQNLMRATTAIFRGGKKRG
jgi:hypothetical protein